MSTETKSKKPQAIYQLKISLRDIEPLIWRRIQLGEDTKLPRLHRILQALFNWENYHLHEFVSGTRVYAVADPENDAKVFDERLVPIHRLAQRVGDSFEYRYDFGDDWQHEILLESILLPEPDVFYPRCIAGARNGPPEDAGGPYGYGEYLEALVDRKHDRHEEMMNWRGPFDPEAFSLKAINMVLEIEFPRRRAKSTRTGRPSLRLIQ